MTDIKFWQGRVRKEWSGHPDMGWMAWDKIALPVIKGNIKPFERVLDVGCGTGRFSDFFDNYVGVDFVPEFIEEAERLHPGKIFIEADMNRLPFDNKEFDWALLISVAQSPPQEVKRVAKKVLLISYGEPKNFEIHD